MIKKFFVSFVKNFIYLSQAHASNQHNQKDRKINNRKHDRKDIVT